MSLLSKLFPGNDEVSKLEASIAENDSIRADLEAAQAKITELSGLSAIIADNEAKITTLETEKTDLTAQLETAKSEIETAKKEIETVKASIPSEIASALASIGQTEPLTEHQNQTEKNEKLFGLQRVTASIKANIASK